MFGNVERKAREEQDIRERQEALRRLSPEELIEQASKRIAEAQQREETRDLSVVVSQNVARLYSGASALEGLANAKLMQEMLRGQQEQAGQVGRVTLGGME